jgi:S-formylglutathione hydrolase FrmB
MGGYGAIKFALKYPQHFVSAHSHSGALGYGHGLNMDWPETKQILGKELVDGGGPNDLYLLATKAKKWKAAKRPALWIDCGREDFLFDDNRAFHAHLKKLRLPHGYHEYTGVHDWNYWDEHIRDALAFHARHLGFKYPAWTAH